MIKRRSIEVTSALLIALMMFAPLAMPVTAAVTGRIYEEVVEEETKYVGHSSTSTRRARQKPAPRERNSFLPPVIERELPALPPRPDKTPCFWFSPPPLLRAPPACA